MNTRHLVLTLFGAVSLALSGCAGGTSNDIPTPFSSTTETPGSSTFATSSIAATTTSSETSPEATAIPETGTVTTPEPVPPPAPPASSQQVTAPTFVKCIYGGGSWTSQALMSDGSYQWSAECQQKLDEQRAEAPYRCPQTDYYVPDPWYCDNQQVPWSVPPPSQVETPAYLLPDSPEEIAGKQWWSDCIAQNTAEYCRSVDPYVNG